MDYFQLLAAFAVSLIATSVAVPPVRRLAVRRGWVDTPDSDRKMHTEPIVCVGGIAIIVGITVGAIYLVGVSNLLAFPIAVPSPYALVGGAIIVGMGFMDDIRGLTFRTKFVIQIE